MSTTSSQAPIKVTIQAVIDAPAEAVWKTFSDPEDIVQWNAASDDWHTTKSTNDLQVGGQFSSTMAAKDGSASFDFTGTYTTVEHLRKIEYKLDDKREVTITFTPQDEGKKTLIVEVFDADHTHAAELQQQGWQAILNNFKKYTEALP